MLSYLDRDHRLQRLHRLTTEVSASRELVDALQPIVSLVHESGALMTHVCLSTTDDGCPRCRKSTRRDPAGAERRLHFVVRAGTPFEPEEMHIFPNGYGIMDEVVRTHRPFRLAKNADSVVRRELLETPRRFPELGLRSEHMAEYLESSIEAVAFFPLMSGGTLLGVLCSSFARPIDDDDFAWLSLCAHEAASAIERVQLREKLSELQTVRPGGTRPSALEAQKVVGDEVVGRSPAFRALLDTIARAAATDSTVLISGETGSGKELVARAIHRVSARRNQPLVTLNCGAVAASLIESELFGHERGAFTGALQRRLGRFEMADRGTLLLDEISELPLDGQVKLLRVLQEREFERVGGSQTLRVNFRLIAATNRDLEAEVAAGRFREDLLYRVNVLPVLVPSLRERRDDIPLFVRHFIDHFHRAFGTTARDIDCDALECLEHYDWPGNVRELRNVIERACVLARGTTIQLDDVRLPRMKRETATLHLVDRGSGDGRVHHITPHDGHAHIPHAATGHTASGAIEPLTTYEEHERNYLRRVLASTGGRVDGPRGAAAILGMNPSTLRSRMQRLGVRRVENDAS